MVNINAVEAWYDENKSIYEGFAKKISDLLTTLIEEEKISYHSIVYRVKTKKSYVDKCCRKAYENPTDSIMDISGIRVIAYTMADVDKICGIIENEFNIDKPNSGNKADLLESDRVGYLSIHYIASLAGERSTLKEYARYKDLVCEIQVRTLLQHAWAEIEHDRSYKFSGVLPENIRRRFHLVAGVLEMMDREFQRLSDEIDHHVEQVRKEAERGNLDIPIDSASLIEFISTKIKNPVIEKNFNSHDSIIVQELNDFGLKTISDVSSLFTPKFLEITNMLKYGNYIGLLRDAMICANTEKYFKNAWNGRWLAYDKDSYDAWEAGGAHIDIVNKYLTIEYCDE